MIQRILNCFGEAGILLIKKIRIITGIKTQKGTPVTGLELMAKRIPPVNGNNNLSNGKGRQGFKISPFSLNQENGER